MSIAKDIRRSLIREVISEIEEKMADVDIMITAIRATQSDSLEIAKQCDQESKYTFNMTDMYKARGRGIERGIETCRTLQRSLGDLLDELKEELEDA